MLYCYHIVSTASVQTPIRQWQQEGNTWDKKRHYFGRKLKHRLRGKSSLLSKAAQLIHVAKVNGLDLLLSSIFQPMIRINKK